MSVATTNNQCTRCLGPIVGDDGTVTINHDWRYGHFQKSLCAMTVEEHHTVARLQLEGGRS